MLCAQAETSMELGTKGGKGGGWPRSRVYGTAVESTVHSICESLPRTVARISLRTFCGPLNRSCPRPSMTLATKETSPVMRLRPPQVGTRWLLKLMPVRAGRSVAGVGGHDRWGGVEFFGEELEGAGDSWALGPVEGDGDRVGRVVDVAAEVEQVT